MILEKLKAYATALPENTTPKFEFRMSSAGDCVRKLDYDLQVGQRAIDAKSFFRMSLGTASHNFLRELVSGAFGEDFYDAEKEIKVETQGLPILGHSDGRIKSLKATLEIKSVSDSTFTMVNNENKPIDAHIDQSNIYAKVQGDENVLILYANRDSGEMCEFMFPSSEELFKATLNKFLTVQRNGAAGIISPRPFMDATQSPCWFCSWKEKCYEGFEKEVGGFKVAEVMDAMVIADARRVLNYRNDRLIATKLEDSLKESVGAYMHSLGLNQAKMSDPNGNMECVISVGKNNNLLTSIKEKKVKK